MIKGTWSDLNSSAYHYLRITPAPWMWDSMDAPPPRLTESNAPPRRRCFLQFLIDIPKTTANGMATQKKVGDDLPVGKSTRGVTKLPLSIPTTYFFHSRLMARGRLTSQLHLCKNRGGMVFIRTVGASGPERSHSIGGISEDWTKGRIVTVTVQC